MIVRELLRDARSLLDEYNEEGTPIPESETASMDANGIRYLNMALNEAYTDSRYYKTVKITRKPIENLLGDQFQIQEFIGEDTSYGGLKPAKAYYFEVDDDSVIYIESDDTGSWEIVDTINVSVTELTAFKGLITAPGNIRITFSGTNYYQYVNFALFAYPFSVDRIPDYRAWVNIQLPEDFGYLNKVVSEEYDQQYLLNSSYKLEGWNDFYIHYSYKGQLRVIYHPIPPVVEDMDDQLPLNNPMVGQFIVYYVAAKLAITDYPEMADFFEQKSNELMFKAMKGQPSSAQKITDVYFGGTYGTN